MRTPGRRALLAPGGPAPPRLLLGLLLGVLLLAGWPAVAADSHYLVEAPEAPGCRSDPFMTGLLPGEGPACTDVTPGRWRVDPRDRHVAHLGDIRAGVLFNSWGSSEGALAGVPSSPDVGPLPLASASREPLFLWQKGAQLPCPGPGYGPLLLAGHASGRDTVTALVQFKTGPESTFATVTHNAATRGWGPLAMLDAKHPVELAVPGLPGHLFVALEKGWAWVRAGQPAQTVSLGAKPIALAATRFLSADPGHMDLVVMLSDRLLVYVGLGDDGAVPGPLQSNALSGNQKSLAAFLVPPVQDAAHPGNALLLLLLLLHNKRTPWRVRHQPTAGGAFAWQRVRWAENMDLKPHNAKPVVWAPGAGRPEILALVIHHRTFFLDGDPACATDRSIVCSPSAFGSCVPAVRMASSPWSWALAIDCLPCAVTNCRTCPDASGTCLVCAPGFLLHRPGPGQADVCTGSCPAGTQAAGGVLAIQAGILDASPGGVAAVCSSRTFLQDRRLHVSNASLAAGARTSSLLAIALGNMLGVVDLGSRRQNPAGPLAVTQLHTLAPLENITQLFELAPRLQAGAVRLDLIIRTRSSGLFRATLTCTLPGPAPDQGCDVQLGAPRSVAGTAAFPLPGHPLGPWTLGFGDMVVEFHPDGSHTIVRLPESAAMLPHWDPSTDDRRAWVCHRSRASLVAHAWDSLLHSPQGRSLPLAATPVPADGWKVLGMGDGSRSAPEHLQPGILHTGLASLNSQVYWAVVHHPAGMGPQGRTRDIPGAGRLLARVPVAWPAAGVAPVAAAMLPLHDLPHYPGAVAGRALPAGPPGPEQPARPAGPRAGCHPDHGPRALSSLPECPAGTFGPECAPSAGSCRTCTGPTPDQCTDTRCDRLLPHAPDACLPRCPEGLVPDGSGACRCQPGCAACAPAADEGYICTACPGGHALGPGDPTRCHPCDRLCAECTRPGDPGAGVRCALPGDLLQPSRTCAGTCPEGTRPQAATRSCEPCTDGGCAQCAGAPDACVTCRPGFRWATGAPPVGSPATGACIACPDCQAGYLLLPDTGTCASGCPAGMAPDAAGRACAPCHGSRAECSAPGSPAARTVCPTGCLQCSRADVCEVCPAGHSDPGDGSCAPCHSSCAPCHSSCAECTGGDACSACKQGLVFLLEDPLARSLCGAACLPGQYTGPGRCRPCADACALCSGGPEACTVCGPGHRWAAAPATPPHGTAACCVAVCPGATYPDGGSATCQPCDSRCAGCAGPTGAECTACIAGLDALAGPAEGLVTGVSACPAGAFRPPGEVACQPCDPACAECNGPTDGHRWRCTGSVLQAGRCVQECAARHVAIGQRCLPCHASCEACSGTKSTECTAGCPAGLLALPAGATPMRCVPGRPVGYSTSAAGCAACPAKCASCPADASACALCDRGWLLEASACVLTCAPGSSALGGVCATCHDTCATCHGPGPEHCLACSPARPFLPAGVCLADCPAGTFPAGATCQPCRPSCAACSGPGASDCTACPDSRVLALDGSCIGACPAGQFAGQRPAPGGRACRACSPACRLCQGPDPGDCIACPEGHLPQEGHCVTSRSAGHFAGALAAACPAGCTGYLSAFDPDAAACASRCTDCEPGLLLSPRTGRCAGACSIGEFLRPARWPPSRPRPGAPPAPMPPTGWTTRPGPAWPPARRTASAAPPGPAPRPARRPAPPGRVSARRPTPATAVPRASCCWPGRRAWKCARTASSPSGMPRCRPVSPATPSARPASARRARTASRRAMAWHATGVSPSASASAWACCCCWCCSWPWRCSCCCALAGPRARGTCRNRMRTRRCSTRLSLPSPAELALPGAMQVDTMADFAPVDDALGTGAQARVFAARAIGAGISARLGCPDTVAIKQLKDSPNPMHLQSQSPQPPR
ncbi:hypothetical protein H696_06120 [Fonticula alba]|uniref:EGF-like domain-containing protein n=1 Tax=Fonticula alba TaxID=691883 RepID=A0A058Z0I2_FONAL|nr:hypothetical protein H696_06120 [Fonticula alba]KCV67428.1 hypothetical protein H696_06120 [Fonticula alba]|eukprot:XP_009498155.1 hypothetical protein H696_06120 [Fonticula alba]